MTDDYNLYFIDITKVYCTEIYLSYRNIKILNYSGLSSNILLTNRGVRGYCYIITNID